MQLNEKWKINIQNFTTTSAIDSDSTPELFDDKNNMTSILSYAIPLSCLAIMTVLLVALAIYRRHHVLEKWNSLTRMKNTNPRFYDRGGLRRDSEYESTTDSGFSVTTIDEGEQIPKESDVRLATIT